MKNKFLAGFVVGALLCVVSPAQARNDIGHYPISVVLDSIDAKEKLDPNIKFYFGDAKIAFETDLGVLKTNKKTNAANKSDEDACQWVFLSALIDLQRKAAQKGANAIVEIRSNYKNKSFVSDKEFECGSGAFVAGVALVGRAVVMKAEVKTP